MKTKLTSASFAVIALVILACSTQPYGNSRTIMREQTGGELALEGDRDVALQTATTSMQQHCGAYGYTVVREGEVTVGQQTQSAAQTSYGSYSAADQQQSTTTNVSEYHIWYQCGTVAATAPPPAVAPAPTAGGEQPAATPVATPAPAPAPAQNTTSSL